MGWRAKLIFVVIFLLVIGDIFYGLYKVMSDEEENKVDIVYREILLDAKDRSTGEVLVANFSIYNGSQLLQSDITRTDSFVQANIPLQYTNVLDIKSSVDGYYISLETIAGNKHTILLDKMGNIFVSHTVNLNNTESEVILNISTNSVIKDISICVRWSSNIISVYNDAYSEVKKLRTKLDCEHEGFQWIPQKIEKYWFKPDNIFLAHCNVLYIDLLPPYRLLGKVDKCYYISQTITKDVPFQIIFNYKSYSAVDNSVKFYILDSELNNANKYVIEDINGKDVGLVDFLYITE